MILVTGSSGHLGEGLVRVLRAEGVAARGLDVLPSPWTDVVGSVADRAVVRAAIDGATPSCTPRRCTSRTSARTPRRRSSTSTSPGR